MSRLVRWTLVAAAALAAACRAAPAVGRAAAADSGEQSSLESAELQDPSAGIVVDSAAFERALRARLSALSDRDLRAVQEGLSSSRGGPDEMMMGDAPAEEDASLPPCPDAADSPPPPVNDDGANNTSEARMRRRERDKKLMLQNIQTKVMNLFNANGRTPPSPSPLVKTHSSLPNVSTTAQIANQQTDALRLLRDNVKSVPSFSAALYTEKTQSFYPICDLPRHTHEDVWNAKDLMNLMFNISFPKPASGNSVNVSVAKLRLYKQLVSCGSQNSNETIDDCQPASSEETIKLSNVANLSSSAEVPFVVEDKQIRVSVYSYTRSLRKKRVKRKLLDSRMLSYFDEKWTEWNIGGAVKSWRRDPNRNYGLSIEVEDEDGNLLPVNRFFRPMNCTGDMQMTTPRPIPGFLIEQAQRDYSLQTSGAGAADPRPQNASTLEAFSFNLFRYPMIDVTTIEVPDSEVNNAVLFQYAKNLIEQNLAAGRAASRPEDAGPGRARKSDQEPSTDQVELHKIRHGGGNNGRHRAANPDADLSDVPGREFRDRIIMKSVVYKNPKASAFRSSTAPAEAS